LGKTFLQTEKLREELTELRATLTLSVQDLGEATKRNHDLTDRLETLTKIIPRLITDRNAVQRKGIKLERQGNSLVSILNQIINDKSDKLRAVTLPLEKQRRILELSLSDLPPLTQNLEKRNPRSSETEKYESFLSSERRERTYSRQA